MPGPVPQPTRFQRRRAAGWKLPFPAGEYRWVCRGRGLVWGNPFEVGAAADVPFEDAAEIPGGLRVDLVRDAGHAVDLFVQWMIQSRVARARARAELAGFHLGCWCSTEPGVPCHGDPLLQVANAATDEEAVELLLAR